MVFDWDPEKNEKIKKERGISFEEIALLLGAGSVWAVTKHWNTEKYPNQRIFLIPIDGRIIAVPFVRDKDRFFSEDRFPLKKDDKTLQRGAKMKPTTEAEEKEIADALERGVIELEKPSRKLLSDLKRASENTFKKDRRINVRLSSHDLLGIQRKALKKGLPYQALISGLIHQYVEGELLEKT